MDRNNCATKASALGMSAGIQAAKPERRGIPGEMDGLESDLCKLGAIVAELRLRLDPVMLSDSPATPGNQSATPVPRRCSFTEGLASFRDRIGSTSRSIQDILDRLDL